MERTWETVDRYLTETVVRPDAGYAELQRAADTAGLPPIQVSAPQGKLLHLLARMVGARRVLEVGTLAGYSTVWLARAVPDDGRVVSLEIDPRHADVARANCAAMGVDHVVEVRVGPALDSLSRLAFDNVAPFDLVFIDADKASIPDYVEWSIQLSHPGSVIVVDNVIRGGSVVDADSEDPNVQGVRRFNEMLAQDVRIDATTIQTVGSKGYDGLTIAVVAEQ
ncbi:MAG TPA: O-methyltransferase [Actinomycetes bacterium]|nr:O-methyltransferase [Actinomycetes bacterium]